MSHKLEVNSKGKHEVFTVGTSWHGLGQVVNEAQTFQKALELGQLDWGVEKIDLFSKGGEQAPAYGIQRDDNNRILGVVGERYVPMQNSEALSFFESFVDQGEAVYESAGAIEGGKKIWLSAKLPEHIQLKGDQSETALYAVAINSHDGSTAITMIVTPIRIVCNNTLRLALNKNKGAVKIRHTKNAADRMSVAADALGITNQYWGEMKDVFNQLANKKVGKTKLESLKEIIYPQVKKEGEWVLTTRAENQRIALEQDMFQHIGQDQIKEWSGWWMYNGLTGHLHSRAREGSEFKVLTDLDWARNKAVDLILS